MRDAPYRSVARTRGVVTSFGVHWFEEAMGVAGSEACYRIRMGWIASIEMPGNRRQRFFVASEDKPANEAVLRYIDPATEEAVTIATPNGLAWSGGVDECPSGAIEATVVETG